jgi:hypothetical protein
MADIFNGSVVTLVAAGSADAHGGLFLDVTNPASINRSSQMVLSAWFEKECQTFMT